MHRGQFTSKPKYILCVKRSANDIYNSYIMTKRCAGIYYTLKIFCYEKENLALEYPHSIEEYICRLR